MVPAGEEVEKARNKRRAEARKRRQSGDSIDPAQEVGGSHKKRPRRAAAAEVNYAEPEDPGVTISDILPGKYIY